MRTSFKKASAIWSSLPIRSAGKVRTVSLPATEDSRTRNSSPISMRWRRGISFTCMFWMRSWRTVWTRSRSWSPMRRGTWISSPGRITVLWSHARRIRSILTVCLCAECARSIMVSWRAMSGIRSCRQVLLPGD